MRDQALVLKLKLFFRGHFYISELRKMLDVAGLIPDGETMRVLELLHCVRYEEMPKQLREQVIGMVVAMFSDSEPRV